MYKHRKICGKAPPPLEEEVEKLKHQVQSLIEKNQDLESCLKTSNTNNYNKCNIQNNIVINSFGMENMKHLPPSFLNYCFANKEIAKLIENIHFDNQCPENHNVRLKSAKKELMEVYTDGKWVISDQDKTLTDLIQNGYRVLRSHGRHYKDDLMDEEDIKEQEFNEIVEWLEKVYDDKKEQKPIKRELLLLFLNNKPVLLGKDC
jgi:hypothetical protein